MPSPDTSSTLVDCSWNVMAHGSAREGKWRGNWRMEWVASALHTTSEHDVSSITTAGARTSAASSRLNWRLRRFKWIRPFRRKTKSGFCPCAVTFHLASKTTSVRLWFDIGYYIICCIFMKFCVGIVHKNCRTNARFVKIVWNFYLFIPYSLTEDFHQIWWGGVIRGDAYEHVSNDNAFRENWRSEFHVFRGLEEFLPVLSRSLVPFWLNSL